MIFREFGNRSVDEYTEGAKVIAVYDIHLRYTLDYQSPEEVPVLKGKLQWFREHERELSPAAHERAREEIAMWLRSTSALLRTHTSV